MEKYASPRGVDLLKHLIFSFAENATHELVETCDKMIREGSHGASVIPARGVWAKVLGLLREIEKVLPGVIDAMTAAQKTVSGFSSVLSSSFTVIEEKAPSGFYAGASLWKMIWVSYYVFYMAINLTLLIWILWFSGFLCSRPAPEQGEYEPPTTFKERMERCCASCNACFRSCLQDSKACFWAVVILLEILVLVAFLLSLVMAILAGIKIFVHVGCAKVYILGDDTICSEMMVALGKWLESFLAKDVTTPLDVCEKRNLLVCELIGNALLKSCIFTVVGGLLGAFFNFQLIIETAILHEQAIWNRIADDVAKEL